jgi:hypothetical protein
MKLLPLLSLLLLSFGSAVQLRFNDESITVDHKTATFGTQIYDFQGSLYVIPQGNGDEFLCTEGSASTMQNVMVVASRGGCSFAEKALNAQKAGAAALIIGDVSATSTVYVWMMCVDSDVNCASITIPVVFVPGTGYQQIQQMVAQHGQPTHAALATESSWIAPPMEPPSATGQTDPTPEPPDVIPEYPVDTEETSVWTGMTLIWIVVGLSVLLKCLIVTIACRRKYRSNRLARRVGSANAAAAVPLTEGEMAEGDMPVVYATYPAPSSAYSVSSASSSEEPRGAQPLSASSLAAYPSVQYAPLLPQATAPEVYDLERQTIVIRG